MVFCCCQNESDVIAEKRNATNEMEGKGLERCPPPTLLSQRVVEVMVQLNVYSLLHHNKKLKKLGMGVYHSGIVVYGIEWGYGESAESASSTGLFCVYPGQAAGTLYRTIFLGVTTHSPQQVDTILHRLENEWRSCDYHILSHNCNHFAQRFCDLLSTVEKLRVPDWCNRAARVCNKIVPNKLAAYVHRLIDEEPPKAQPSGPTRVSELPQSVIPRNWYLHPSILQSPRYAATREHVDETWPVTPLGETMDDITCTSCSPGSRNGDDETPTDSVVPTAVATLHRDPLCRDSLELKEGPTPDVPLPLQQDANEVVFLAAGSDMVQGASSKSHVLCSAKCDLSSDGTGANKSFVRLESLASQMVGAHTAEVGSEASHLERTDGIPRDNVEVAGNSCTVGEKEEAHAFSEQECTCANGMNDRDPPADATGDVGSISSVSLLMASEAAEGHKSDAEKEEPKGDANTDERSDNVKHATGKNSQNIPLLPEAPLVDQHVGKTGEDSRTVEEPSSVKECGMIIPVRRRSSLPPLSLTLPPAVPLHCLSTSETNSEKRVLISPILDTVERNGICCADQQGVASSISASVGVAATGAVEITDGACGDQDDNTVQGERDNCAVVAGTSKPEESESESEKPVMNSLGSSFVGPDATYSDPEADGNKQDVNDDSAFVRGMALLPPMRNRRWSLSKEASVNPLLHLYKVPKHSRSYSWP
ncbi:hypothetical protein DQ04_02941030 [Trypanosoma grayi]|uniref:hypothetical protein n=1 Tax=Trypanosoma grayi TaxID=71804 RepID=UPI0004F46D97|nr:hypothetical protein DQ04_02941030 [Trypanosoma grayi]KEG11140.1 hypothetical protein DQ04_02941030 [Trypanosoma grayi]